MAKIACCSFVLVLLVGPSVLEHQLVYVVHREFLVLGSCALARRVACVSLHKLGGHELDGGA